MSFSAVQAVHMFEVNKPGVDTSAAVFKAEEGSDIFCWSFTKSFTYSQNRTRCGIKVCLTDKLNET